MATNAICVIMTEEKQLFVGLTKENLNPFLEGQKVKKTEWKEKPRGLDNFLKKNPEEEVTLVKAIHYWALCSLGRLEHDENQYGLIKRKLSKFGDKLYRRVRNFARSIAAAFKKVFPSPWKQAKMKNKFFAFSKKRKEYPVLQG
jgi:hypothetical protein